MAEIIRNSILAVVEESTEGTPVAPSAATDFTALQDDFEISPEFAILENSEIKASLAPSKPILGVSNPSGSFSHYLRHSGTEGQAPDFNLFLKAAFGDENVNATERATTTASTTSLIKLAAGGTDFDRGYAVLVKDGTNGYSIRPVHSVSTNDLTPAFNLDAAPGSGVNVGKCVNYSPANSGHSSLSIWHYVANAGAVQLVAGAKCTEFGFEASAGELINASFGFEGTKFFFNPIVIAAADTKLDFNDGSTDYAATVTAKTYTDPHELADALETSMNAQGASDTFTVTYNDTGASKGKFTIASDGATLSLLWNTGTNTANTIGDKLGFTISADDTGALTYTSDTAQSYAAAYSPSYDSSDPLAAKDNEVFIGDAADSTCFEANSISFSMGLTKQNIESVCAETGVSGSVIGGREVTVEIVAYLDRYDVEKFQRFREGTETKFSYTFGTKSGGNWVAGKCVNLYVPTATVSAFSVTDLDGLVAVNLSLRAYADSSGNGEVYLNFL